LAFIHEHHFRLPFESEADGLVFAFPELYRFVHLLDSRDAQPNR
jgi:hypothetical protein